MSELPEPQIVTVNHIGILQSARPATPSEIAAAHPKCETCGHQYECDQRMTYNPFTDGQISERVDYCPHHTALTKPTGDK